MRKADDPELLDSIYEAAFDRQAFGRLGSVVATAADTPQGFVSIHRPGGLVDVAIEYAASVEDRYLAHYSRIDPWTPRLLSSPPFEIRIGQEIVPDEVILNSEFYVDFARAQGVRHPMGMSAPLAPGEKLIVSVNRPFDAPRFDEQDRIRFERVARHVHRAMQLRRRFREAETISRASRAALDALNFGVAILDAERRVVLVNSAAEALCREGAGIVAAAGKLTTMVQREAQVLARFVREAATGLPGGAMRITGRDGAVSLLALVTLLPRALGDGRDTRGLALAAFRRASDSLQFAEAVLAQLFGLSPAEVQIVHGLLAGRALDEIAHARGVKIATLRTQLESIFRKTGTEGQRDLVRLLGLLPQTR